MEIALHFTEEEIEDFLMKKGFKPFIKTKTINHGPYGKQEYDVEVKYVTNIVGTEFTQKEAFDKLLKKRLLEW